MAAIHSCSTCNVDLFWSPPAGTDPTLLRDLADHAPINYLAGLEAP